MTDGQDATQGSSAVAARHRCRVVDDDGATLAEFDVPGSRPVLHQMQMAGIRALTIGCRGGGCGACRVTIVDGTVELRRMSRRHVTDDDRSNGIALACCILPTSDLVVRAAPRSTAPSSPATATSQGASSSWP